MTPEQKCVSLETAKRLKEAGFPQEGTEHYWSFYDGGASREHPGLIHEKECNFSFLEELVAAPDAQEIEELMPNEIEYNKDGYRGAYLTFDKGSASYRDSNSHIIIKDDGHECYFMGNGANNLVEARAACWLWLKKQKLI